MAGRDPRSFPHLQAAKAVGQAKREPAARREPAAHVRAAIAASQPKKISPLLREPAAHVRAAVSSVQAKSVAPATPWLAPNLLAALSAVQPATSAPPWPASGGSIQCAAPLNNQLTTVTLRVGGATYVGKSSGQQGHAEMDALDQFIRDCEGRDLDPGTVLAAAGSKTVQCEAKPVCVACSRALRSKGIGAYSDATVFGDEKSGGVAWGAGLKVRAFLGQDVYADCCRLGAK